MFGTDAHGGGCGGVDGAEREVAAGGAAGEGVAAAPRASADRDAAHAGAPWRGGVFDVRVWRGAITWVELEANLTRGGGDGGGDVAVAKLLATLLATWRSNDFGAHEVGRVGDSDGAVFDARVLRDDGG